MTRCKYLEVKTYLYVSYSDYKIYYAGLSGRLPAEIVGSNPTGGMDICLLWVSCCQVEVSAMGWSLVQRSPTDCDASLCVI